MSGVPIEERKRETLGSMHREKTMWGESKYSSICKPKREVSGEINSTSTLSWSSSLQDYGKMTICYLSHPVCGTSLWQPKKTNSGHNWQDKMKKSWVPIRFDWFSNKSGTM